MKESTCCHGNMQEEHQKGFPEEVMSKLRCKTLGDSGHQKVSPLRLMEHHLKSRRCDEHFGWQSLSGAHQR